MSNIGEIRLSQSIMTFGPGALVDFPRDSAIMGGLDSWPTGQWRREIHEPRLRAKLRNMTGQNNLRLISPPVGETPSWQAGPKITAWRFPNWFLVHRSAGGDPDLDNRTRRLVHRSSLDTRMRFEEQQVVPIRFVQACPVGHVADVDWKYVLGCKTEGCQKPLWMEEQGAGGDLGELRVRCECGKSRSLDTLKELGKEGPSPLGLCGGQRPWLGHGHYEPGCRQPLRLLIRTATNAYFALTVSVLSIPEQEDPLITTLKEYETQVLPMATAPAALAFLRNFPGFGEAVATYSDDQLWTAIQRFKEEDRGSSPVKEAELEAILKAPTEYMQELPPSEDFLARKLPESMWRHGSSCDGVEAVIQLHRLREVMALRGFTRFEAPTPDIHGEYDGDVQVAAISVEEKEFPAVENRGEGIFVQLNSEAVDRWRKRQGVRRRAEALSHGHERWKEDRKRGGEFVDMPYILLHTLSHLLIQSLALSCGYPATSIRERIYVENGKYGILLYTSTPDAEGTLGGLVSEARHIAKHLEVALRHGELCSNDPICSQHDPSGSLEQRWLHGASCHGCSLIAETSCEMRNEHLDRALVVPVLGTTDAAFFALP